MHKGPGALSPITLSINSPGSMLTAFSQATAGKSFALWMPYVLSGAQQAVIVGLIIFFYCRNRRNKNKSAIEDILENDPGFQGPALLLEDSDSDAEDALMSTQHPYSDNDFTSTADSEEDAEEDGTDEESLIKRRKRPSSRSNPPITSSSSIPSYDKLLPQ